MEQGLKVYTRKRRRNPLLTSPRTSENRQTQQSQNQVEVLHNNETTNEGQHMHQQIESPISGHLATEDSLTIIASTTTRITLGNPRDNEILRGLRRLTHVRKLARSLRQQNNDTEDNINNGNEHDQSLLHGLHRLTHVRRLARSLGHDQTTIMRNSPNGGEVHVEHHEDS